MSSSVLVCRGCCCGTEDKHPGEDHDAQVEALRRALPANGRLWTVDCLGPCERSNVVVVRQGEERWWFGEVRPGERTDALAAWLAGTGPAPPSFRPDDTLTEAVLGVDADTYAASLEADAAGRA